jgi:hypothetical protein
MSVLVVAAEPRDRLTCTERASGFDGNSRKCRVDARVARRPCAVTAPPPRRPRRCDRSVADHRRTFRDARDLHVEALAMADVDVGEAGASAIDRVHRPAIAKHRARRHDEDVVAVSGEDPRLDAKPVGGSAIVAITLTRRSSTPRAEIRVNADAASSSGSGREVPF